MHGISITMEQLIIPHRVLRIPTGTVGRYTVNLTVTNSAGSDSEIKVNYINATAAAVSGTTNVGVFRPSARQFIYNTTP